MLHKFHPQAPAIGASNSSSRSGSHLFSFLFLLFLFSSSLSLSLPYLLPSLRPTPLSCAASSSSQHSSRRHCARNPPAHRRHGPKKDGRVGTDIDTRCKNLRLTNGAHLSAWETSAWVEITTAKFGPIFFQAGPQIIIAGSVFLAAGGEAVTWKFIYGEPFFSVGEIRPLGLWNLSKLGPLSLEWDVDSSDIATCRAWLGRVGVREKWIYISNAFFLTVSPFSNPLEWLCF